MDTIISDTKKNIIVDCNIGLRCDDFSRWRILIRSAKVPRGIVSKFFIPGVAR